MFFTSAIVAQSHYQGKTHAKRVRLVLGEPPSLSAVASLTDAGLILGPLRSYSLKANLMKAPIFVVRRIPGENAYFFFSSKRIFLS